VSEHIIHSAHFADGVNRAGQLRMLSQRLIKLVLLQVAGVQIQAQQARIADSVGRIDTNLALLTKSLSKPTFGDLLGQTVATWKLLKKALQGALQVDQLDQIDALAEALLQNAERLTSSLENAGAVAPLQVLNVAGRQRMLSQRYAKFALQGSEAGMAEAKAAIDQGLNYLNSIPLSTPDIRGALTAATQGWQQMLAGATQAARPAGQERLADASESLLDVFEQLSGHYERSMQMLVG
jgi:nitrate/nitrite-specific signal transduction histidine kinase